MTLFDQLQTVDDVQALIDEGVRESETLDYKRLSAKLRPADYTDAAKDISAFANTIGGTLVYGVATAKEDQHLPTHAEPILPENIASLERALAVHVRPPIRGVRWKTIPQVGTPQFLIVDVPESAEGPHQVAVDEYRYFRRQGAESRPMTHDLIALHFGRRRGANIEIHAHLDSVGTDARMPMRGPFGVRFTLENVGGAAARHVFLVLSVDAARNVGVRNLPRGAGNPRLVGEDPPGVYVLTYKKDDAILYPGFEELALRLSLDVEHVALRAGTTIASAIVFADEMVPRGAEFSLIGDLHEIGRLESRPMTEEEQERYIRRLGRLQLHLG